MATSITGCGVVYPVVDGHVVDRHLNRAIAAGGGPECSGYIFQCGSSVFGEQCGPASETATRAVRHSWSVVVEQVEAHSGAIGEYGSEGGVFRKSDLCRSLGAAVGVEHPPDTPDPVARCVTFGYVAFPVVGRESVYGHLHGAVAAIDRADSSSDVTDGYCAVLGEKRGPVAKASA